MTTRESAVAALREAGQRDLVGDQWTSLEVRAWRSGRDSTIAAVLAALDTTPQPALVVAGGHDPQCSLRDTDEMPSERRCTCAPQPALGDDERAALVEAVLALVGAELDCEVGKQYPGTDDAQRAYHRATCPGCSRAQRIYDAVAAADLAARAHQPTPPAASEPCGECEDGCVHGTVTPCPRCHGRLVVQLTPPAQAEAVAAVEREVREVWAIRFSDGDISGGMYSGDGSDHAERTIREAAESSERVVHRTETITRTPWEPALTPAQETDQ